MKMLRCCFAFVMLLVPCAASAQSGVGSVAALTKLLDSGRVPPERQGVIIEMICTRGQANELASIVRQLVAGDYDVALQRKVLTLLNDAAVTRKVRPAGNLAGIVTLASDVKAPDDVRRSALRLAATWRVPEVVDSLTSIVGDKQSGTELRLIALDGLAAIGDARAKETLGKAALGGDSSELRARAAAALAKIDLSGAAVVAAGALASAGPSDDIGPLYDAFLTRKGGPDLLAAALAKTAVSADAAKLGLRYIYSVGRSDAALSNVLSTAAGISTDPKPPTPAELKQLLAEVIEKGDAARGEKVFRRADLSCQKCHAISRAGGNVGPDLSALGSISPIDYVANSILDPNLAIKEQFVTRVIITDDGQTFTGIVVDRDDQRVNLRDAAGKVIAIPTADIDEEAEGRSLMPQGLTKFLTRQELLDLVRFISELGKPGPYAIRPTPTIQRWRVLKAGANAPAGLPKAPPEAWTTAYGMTAGSLPTAELGLPGGAVYLQGEFDVVEAGEIVVRIAAPAETKLWIDDKPHDALLPEAVPFKAGRHRLTLRVTIGTTPDESVTATLEKPAGAKTQFDVVGGP